MARHMRIASIRKTLAIEQEAKTVVRIDQALGMPFKIRTPSESDRRRPTEDLEVRLYVPDPAVENELINIPRIHTVLRQGDDNCIEIVDSVVPRIVVPLLLLDTKDKPPVLDKSDRPVMRQLDTADAHSCLHVVTPAFRMVRTSNQDPSVARSRIWASAN